MGNENELKEYCCEIDEIKVKDEPIEYDVINDDKKMMSVAVQSGIEKLKAFVDKIHVNEHEPLEAGYCIISCKVEPEENYVYVRDLNEDCNVNHDTLLVTQSIETTIASGDILYNCPRCTYTSNSCRNYKRHVQRHDNIKKFVCTVCEKRFHENRRLQQHMLTHNGKKMFHCSLCDYGAKRKDYITKHIQNKHAETNDKRYKCPKCKYETNDKYGLKKHDVVHRDARLYVCEICYKQFKRAGELKAHGFVHDEEKRYQCAHCDYKTKTKMRLVMHLQNKHLGPKIEEYQCSKCTFRTIYSYALKRHLRRHSENVEDKLKYPECADQIDKEGDLGRRSDL